MENEKKDPDSRGFGGLDFSPRPKAERQPRQKPMSVLCLGLSRTGTMSQYAALKQLGFSPYHCAEMNRNTASGSLSWWRKAIDAKFYGGSSRRPQSARDFDEMLWDYDAVTDIPAVLFAEELLHSYPSAKIVLSERDANTWLASVENSFFPILNSWRWRFLAWTDVEFAQDYVAILRSTIDVWTNGDTSSRQALRQGYVRHNEQIKELVPREQLLLFHPRDGWEPICKFLGKPVPDGPFPRVNEGNATRNVHLLVMGPKRVRAALFRLLPSLITLAMMIALSALVFGKYCRAKALQT